MCVVWRGGILALVAARHGPHIEPCRSGGGDWESAVPLVAPMRSPIGRGKTRGACPVPRAKVKTPLRYESSAAVRHDDSLLCETSRRSRGGDKRAFRDRPGQKAVRRGRLLGDKRSAVASASSGYWPVGASVMADGDDQLPRELATAIRGLPLHKRRPKSLFVVRPKKRSGLATADHAQTRQKTQAEQRQGGGFGHGTGPIQANIIDPNIIDQKMPTGVDS